jgi:hypothetical protein
MPADYSTGIVVGLLLGVLGSAILWVILYFQVQGIRRRVDYASPVVNATWIIPVPPQRAGTLAIAPYQPDPQSDALLAQTHTGGEP